MEDRAFEVYKWILYRVNGYSKDEIKNIDPANEWSEIEQIRHIIEDGRKYDEVF